MSKWTESKEGRDEERMSESAAGGRHHHEPKRIHPDQALFYLYSLNSQRTTPQEQARHAIVTGQERHTSTFPPATKATLTCAGWQRTPRIFHLRPGCVEKELSILILLSIIQSKRRRKKRSNPGVEWEKMVKPRKTKLEKISK